MYDAPSSQGVSLYGRELIELRAENAKLRERIDECVAGSGLGRGSIPGDPTPREEVGTHVSAFTSTFDVYCVAFAVIILKFRDRGIVSRSIVYVISLSPMCQGFKFLSFFRQFL